MSRSDWGKLSQIIGLAAFGSVVTALYWAMFYDMGLQAGHHRERAQIEREHHRTDAAKQIEEVCAIKSGSALRECIAETIEAERESQRSESDLAAQWQAADWVLWATIIAGAQLIATIAGLYFVKRTLDATLDAVEDTGLATLAMMEANRISQNANEQQLRAYVTGGTPEVKVVEDSMIIYVKWKNSGQTPARKLAGFVILEEVATTIPYNVVFKSRLETDIPAGTLMLGPGGDTNQTAETILRKDAAIALSEGRAAYVIYAFCEYLDAFDKVRRTETAFKLGARKIGSKVEILFSSLPHHNGMDEDCFYPPSYEFWKLRDNLALGVKPPA